MIQWWSFFLRDTVMILNKLITKHKGNVGFTANLFCSKQNVLARKITKKLLYYVVNTWYRLEQILNICFLKKRFWTFVIFMLGLRPARRKQTKLLLERSLGYPANQMVSRGERIWFVQWEQHSNLPIPLLTTAVRCGYFFFHFVLVCIIQWRVGPHVRRAGEQRQRAR
jgi:hypothetical protein